MMKINTIDLWIEQYTNYYEYFNVVFMNITKTRIIPIQEQSHLISKKI